LLVALALGLVGSASAQSASGIGSITCDGDGVVVLSGDFTTVSVSVDAGALIHNKPTSGVVTVKTGRNFVKYISGVAVLHVGAGSATAQNVKGLKLTLSGANAHLEATGTGKVAVRGEGSCTLTNGAKTVTWTNTDATVTVTP
jgi:hypothetical protein